MTYLNINHKQNMFKMYLNVLSTSATSRSIYGFTPNQENTVTLI